MGLHARAEGAYDDPRIGPMPTLTDSFGRRIDYLRVSVTDRCNYRCFYCMPAGGVALDSHREFLSYEELTRLIRLFS